MHEIQIRLASDRCDEPIQQMRRWMKAHQCAPLDFSCHDLGHHTTVVVAEFKTESEVNSFAEKFAGMLLHKFKKRRGWRAALTQDATGGNLPQDGEPWEYEKQIVLHANDNPRIGASSAEIIAGVEANGYYLWERR
jgi:hypothetical protein